MTQSPDISFFVQAQKQSMEARINASKSKLQQAYQHFLSIPPKDDPELLVYTQLSDAEMVALVDSAIRDIQVMGHDYCEAAVQLGWLEATSDWYRGAPGLSHSLAKAGTLVQFYGMLKYLRQQKPHKAS